MFRATISLRIVTLMLLYQLCKPVPNPKRNEKPGACSLVLCQGLLHTFVLISQIQFLVRFECVNTLKAQSDVEPFPEDKASAKP